MDGEQNLYVWVGAAEYHIYRCMAREGVQQNDSRLPLNVGFCHSTWTSQHRALPSGRDRVALIAYTGPDQAVSPNRYRDPVCFATRAGGAKGMG